MPAEPLSKRETARRVAAARRERREAFRQWSFDGLARGWSVEQLAEMRKVRPRTVRREIAAVVAARRLDAPERYLHVQLARLNKALRVADGALDRGNLKAVGPMIRLVAALDRYHGLRGPGARLAVAAEPISAPVTPAFLARPAPALAAPGVAYADSERGTDFGAQALEFAAPAPDFASG